MSFDFVLPLNREDLLRQSGRNHYVVEDVHPVRILPAKLQAMQMALRSQGPLSLIQHFDTPFSILQHWQSVASEIKEDSWNLLVKVVSGLSSSLVEVLDKAASDNHLRITHLNLLKMAVYILCQFIDALEAEASEAAAGPTAQKTGRGRKKAQRALVADALGDIKWEMEREKGVRQLLQLLMLNIHTLWDPPVIEEEFVNLVTCCCYKLLENAEVVKDRATRDTLFQLLGVMVKKYGHALGCSLKILQLLQHFEHLSVPLAQAVQMFAMEYGVKSITGEIMREIGRMDTRDLARDSSGTRAYAVFLVELAERIPDIMLPSISVLLPLLDKEPYTMRNSVLGVLGEICVQVLTKEDLDANQKSTRDQFMDKLEDHIHDVNAFVRGKTLQIWLTIVSEKALPLSRQHQLLTLVIGRLQDKSSHARKYAIQLTTALLQSNPFAAKLSLEELKTNYEAEKEKLAEMTPAVPVEEATEDVVLREVENEWRRLSDLIEATLKEAVDNETDGVTNQTDLIPDDDSVQTVKMRMVALLKDSHVAEAVSLYRAGRDAFPDDPAFTPSSDASGDVNMDEDPQEVAAVLAGIKSVFFGELMESAVIEGAVGHLACQALPATPPASSSHDNSLVNELIKQQVLVQYLKDSMNFVGQIQKAVPVMSALLGSKTVTDVLEAINFFVAGFRFGVSNSMVGVRRMLVLVWSKEQTVKDAVVSAYRDLYINSHITNPRAQALSIVNNLTALMTGATVGDLSSMEAMMGEFVRTGDLDSHVIQLLWERFAMKITGITEEDGKAALVLLGMAASAEVEIVRCNVDVLVKEGLGERGEKDLLLVKDTCMVLTKLAVQEKSKPGETSEPFRFPKDHEMFTRLTHIMKTSAQQLEASHWLSMAEQAMNVIYKLAEHPDLIAADIIKHMASVLGHHADCSSSSGGGGQVEHEGVVDKVCEEGRESSELQQPPATQPASSQQPRCLCPDGVLTRFLSLAGHVALRQLVHLDVATQGEMKRRNAVQEGKTNEKNVKKRRAAAPSADDTATVAAKKIKEADDEEEMALAGASADDAEAEFISKITEAETVTGTNLLALLGPLMVAVCSNPTRYDNLELQAAASLAISKYMLVSSDFCEENLQLLFTILEKSVFPILRANAIIALGDLAVRFPNLVEPWTPNLYARLRDHSPYVRKNTLMVLTHLILDDMVKVKGQISELATCIVDGDEQISGLAKLFFHELSRKGNAIYNIMPDMVSRLSDTDVGVSEDYFRIIMKHLFSFIQKDRQCESLVEKLCHRFRATVVVRQWRDIAFCLSLMSFNDRALKKLQENLPCFTDKMADEDIYNSFMTVLNNSKKFAKPETKALIDELEQCFEECHNKGVEDADVAQQATKAHRSPSSKTPGRRGRHAKAKTPATRARKASGNLDKSRFLSTPVGNTRAKRKPGKAAKPSFDSDEDSDIDMFHVDERSPSKADNRTSCEVPSDAENDDPNISLESPGLRQLKRQHPRLKKSANTRMRHRDP